MVNLLLVVRAQPIVATKTQIQHQYVVTHQKVENFHQEKMNTVVPHQKTIVQVGQLYVVTETGQTMFCHLIDQQMQNVTINPQPVHVLNTLTLLPLKRELQQATAQVMVHKMPQLPQQVLQLQHYAK
jgi:hypothetical protein